MSGVAGAGRSGARVPVLVVGGYLGAGKTTLVNRILAADHGLRIVVLVNDVGAIAVDAALIAATGGDTIELTNGCVCCTIGDSLVDTLHSLAERPGPVDLVVIEASGVADPATVAAYAHLPGYRLDGLVVLADAATVTERLADRLVGTTVLRQLRNADVVLVTKLDVAAMPVLPLDGVPVLDARAVSVDALLGRGGTSRTPAGHAPHTSTVLEPPVLPIDALRAWLDELPADVVRVKGAVVVSDRDAPVLVQRVGARTALSAAPPGLAPGLVVIAVGTTIPPLPPWPATTI